jgi:photosystem II stability/assembly factor-like uncharacterized protein
MRRRCCSRRRRGGAAALAAALFLLSCPFGGLRPLAAQEEPAAPSWHPLPLYAGDIRSLAIAPDDPDVVLAGTSAGQVYVSRNGGGRWRDAGAPLPFPGWVVSSLRFDPNRPGRLWVALWGVWGSGQVAFSDDLGASWSARSQGLPDEPVYTVALAPGRPGRLFAGTLSGVYGSRDGGASWRPLTAALPELQKVTSLIVDPTRPDTVIAGTWRRAYRSDDGGESWSGIFEGMVLDSELFSLTPVAEHPGEIWASTCGWVYQTLDRGDHWQRWKDGLDERRTPALAVLPDGRVLAGTVSGVYVSEVPAAASGDAVRKWKRVSDPAIAVQVMAVHPALPRRVILGTEGSGIWISNDGAASFYRSSRGITNTRVSALARQGADLLVAVNHAGMMSGVYVSHDRGRSFSAEFSALPTILDLAVHGAHVYAATVLGLFERRGNDWFRLAETGTGRILELPAEGDHLFARTPEALFELRQGKFVPVSYKHGPPRSAAYYDGALWVSDAQGLYRLTSDANHTAAPPAGNAGNGRLQRLGDRLLWTGSEGAFVREAGPGDAWTEITTRPSRALRTGDERYPTLLVSGDAVRLYDRAAAKLRLLAVPVPARDIAAALVWGGTVLLGTSGYGVLAAELPAAPAPPADAPAPPPPAPAPD